MASTKPVVRQIAGISILTQIFVLLLLIGIFGVDAGLLIFLAAAFLLRQLVPRNHRKGIRYFKSGEYSSAIAEFEKSYAFFEKHTWIDRYRYLVVLTSSRISYREMALLNMAYCYGQMGQGEKARHYYCKTLEQFPDSEMAKSALRMLDSVQERGEATYDKGQDRTLL